MQEKFQIYMKVIINQENEEKPHKILTKRSKIQQQQQQHQPFLYTIRAELKNIYEQSPIPISNSKNTNNNNKKQISKN